MKKVVIIGTILAVAVAAFFAGTLVYAANAQQPTPQGGMYGGGRGQGGGMMGGQGGYGRGGGMMGAGWDGDYGPMHEYMIPALAEGLGLTAEELQARIDAGETPYEVAVSLGFSAEEIQTIFTTAHAQALQAAVDAGIITQEQADWMSTHMQQRRGNGYGAGAGNCPMHQNP